MGCGCGDKPYVPPVASPTRRIRADRLPTPPPASSQPPAGVVTPPPARQHA